MNTSFIFPKLNNIIFTAIQALLAIRLFFRLFGANEKAPIVEWIYRTTEPLLYPFSGIFPSTRLNGLFTLEITTLAALLSYAFIGYIIGEVAETMSFRAEKRIKEGK